MIVTQNGDREKEFNILQACAQKIIGYDDWQSYWPFLVPKPSLKHWTCLWMRLECIVLGDS